MGFWNASKLTDAVEVHLGNLIPANLMLLNSKTVAQQVSHGDTRVVHDLKSMYSTTNPGTLSIPKSLFVRSYVPITYLPVKVYNGRGTTLHTLVLIGLFELEHQWVVTTAGLVVGKDRLVKGIVSKHVSRKIVIAGLLPADLTLGGDLPAGVHLPVMTHVALGDTLATLRALLLLTRLEFSMASNAGLGLRPGDVALLKLSLQMLRLAWHLIRFWRYYF